MFSPDIIYLVGQEQTKDRMRQIEQHNLIQTTTTQRRDGGETYAKAANWLGNQLVKWGTKLQRYNTPLVKTS